MTEPAPVMPVSTFIVRFWQEWSASGPAWRGRISHVQSGEGTTFLDLEDMLAFVRSLGIMTEIETASGVNSSRDAKHDEP